MLTMFFDAMKRWRDEGGRVHHAIASLSAALVVASGISGRRPSDSLAWLAKQMGSSTVAAWFGDQAPPFVSARSVQVQHWMFWAIGTIFVVLVGTPFLRYGFGRFEDFLMSSFCLIGAPAACTAWILMAVAAQQGTVEPVVNDLAYGGHLAFVAMVPSAVGGVIAWIVLARRFGPRSIPAWLLGVVGHAAGRIIIGTSGALLALAVAGTSEPLRLLIRLLGLAPRRSSGTQPESTEPMLPTGAVSTPPIRLLS